MNLMFAKFNWNETRTEGIRGKNQFRNRHLELYVTRTNNFHFDAKSFYYNPETRVLSSVIGYISNLEDVKAQYSIKADSDVEIVERIYQIRKEALTQELDGVFLIVLVDEKVQKGFILQSQYGFNLPVYFTSRKDESIFSTSLKKVLKHSCFRRELDNGAVFDVLYCGRYGGGGVIPNRNTLVRGIKKLLPNEYAMIDAKTHAIDFRSTPQTERKSRRIAKRELLNSISDHTTDLFHQLRNKNLTQTLTAGWDSNLILYYLRNLTDERINAVTISGGEGRNEVPAVEEILKHYKSVNHVTTEVAANIHSFPDMVWRYEGYVFQEGMFLRYELSKLLNRNQYPYIFLGGCADQILIDKWIRDLNKLDYIKIPYLWMKSIRRNGNGHYLESRLRRELKRDGFQAELDPDIDYLLKIHEIMLNSFGIQGIYPFVNKNTAGMSKALGILNWKKAFYKKRIRESIQGAFIHQITKSGSVVNTGLLFEKNKDLLMKLFHTRFIEGILTKSQIQRIIQSPKTYHLIIFQLLYIYLFNELLISGRFDAMLDQPSMNRPLTEFLV